MDILTIVLFILGLGLLIGGAELLVRGASRIAAGFGISPLVIGLTIVAFGTSSPEMAVSVSTALQGVTDIAVGNVVGSNIFNVLFILGISALITPLVVGRQMIRLEVPIMIGVSLLYLALALDGTITFWEGALLFAGIVAYTVFQIAQARREKPGTAATDEFTREYGEKEKQSTRTTLINIGLAVVGLVLLVIGSNWLVNGAIAFARLLEIDEVVIGLTIVAAGTSLPEVATSILASIRGERDIAVGNVVGSNIFNILAVLGASALASPAGLSVPPSINAFDGPVMLAVAVACLPIFFTGNVIARWEGAVFLLYYVAYTAYLILDAYEHAALPMFSNVMFYFVLPITVLTIAIALWRARHTSPTHASHASHE
jgi:cation:H+ antiporter